MIARLRIYAERLGIVGLVLAMLASPAALAQRDAAEQQRRATEPTAAPAESAREDSERDRPVGNGGAVQGSSDWVDVVIASIALCALAIVGLGFVIYLKRRLTAEPEGAGDTLTLSGLRQLHASGQITDADFEQAKAAIIAQYRPATSVDSAEAPNTPAKRPSEPRRSTHEGPSGTHPRDAEGRANPSRDS